MPRCDRRPRAAWRASSSVASGRRRRAGSPRIDDEQHRVAARERGLAGSLVCRSDGAVAAKTAVMSSGGYSPLRRSTVTWPAGVRPSPLTTSAQRGAVSQSRERLIRGRRCRGCAQPRARTSVSTAARTSASVCWRDSECDGDPQHDHAVVAEADRLAVLPVDQNVVCEGRVDDLALGAERPAAVAREATPRSSSGRPSLRATESSSLNAANDSSASC